MPVTLPSAKRDDMGALKDGFMRFNRGERAAVIVMAAAVVVLVGVCVFTPFQSSPRQCDFHPLDSLLSARNAALNARMEAVHDEVMPDEPHLSPFPFNPNGLPEEDWRRMGMTERQIRNIKNYEAKGGKFYSKRDVQKLYAISDEEFAVLEPFIVIPPLNKSLYQSASRYADAKGTLDDELKKREPAPVQMVEVNSADSALFAQLPKVNPYLAARIVSFRERLGGFLGMEQLLEVKGMDSLRFEECRPYLSILEVEIVRVDVNRADFKALVNHPYLNYDMVKAIVRHRETRGMIKDWEQLTSVLKGFPLHEDLERYVKF